MVLQLFIDDSVEVGNVTVLAGYMADSEKWGDFSRDWSQLLTIRPQWSSFKMSNIMTNGGDETHERAMFHYRCIEDHLETGFCVAVPHEPLARLVAEFRLADKWKNPYFMAYIVLISVIRHYMVNNRPGEVVEITFDTQLGEYRTVLDSWNLMVERNAGDIRPFSGPPAFERDEDFLGLQAADLFAWLVRKKYKDVGSITRDADIFPWELRSAVPNYLFGEVTENGMRKHISKSLNPYLRHSEFGPSLMIPGRSFLK